MSQSVHGTWLSLTLYLQQVLCRTCSQTVHAIVPTHMLQYRASPRSHISIIDCTWAPHCCHGWLRAFSIDSTAWSSNGREHRDQHALASANTPLFDLIAPVRSLSECCVPQLCCTVEDRACHGKTCVAASTKAVLRLLQQCLHTLQTLPKFAQVSMGNARWEAGRKAFPLKRARPSALDQYLLRLHEGCIACHMA